MTNKEFTGPEFEIEFVEKHLAWLKGGKVGVDPRTLWEYKTPVGWHAAHPEIAAEFGLEVNYVFRWKPTPKRMVTIGYRDLDDGDEFWKTLVAPEVEAPKKGTVVWLLSTNGGIADNYWDGMSCEFSWLKEGKVFLTHEDAQAMADWLAVCRRGGV